MAKKPPQNRSDTLSPADAGSVPKPPVSEEPSFDAGLFGEAVPNAAPYVVLARKYRPQAFPDLIGQDAMVQTLRNAFATGRIAQGYMLTGVRGVGKTTTARILARGLNYETDAVAAPTVDMPVPGRHCAEIIASRHPDVVEMDAASNTGVDSVREIIEGARYKPISARTKVYIIDEVHMLSKGAFNALLKTLEEPPEHVKFIFATTEVRKVPVTVLSRCQRFDLRRVDVPVLSAHLKSIVASEGAKADDDAIAMIARAAEGSVRDSLSILDQAIAMAGGAPVTASLVRAMLGLSDRGRILDLLETLASGDTAKALADLEALHRDGAEPVQVLADLSEAVHFVTRMKVIPGDAGADTLSADEKRRIKALGQALSVPLLSRYWQMLQKGHAEAGQSGDPLAAAEMVLIRIAHTADLPSPDDLVRMLGGDEPQRRTGLASAGASDSGLRADAGHRTGYEKKAGDGPSSQPPWTSTAVEPGSSAIRAAHASSAIAQGAADRLPPAIDPASYAETLDPEAIWAGDPGVELELAGDTDLGIGDPEDAPGSRFAEVSTFADVLALVGRMRDAKLKVELEEHVSLVKIDASAGSLDLFLMPGAPASLPNDLREKLKRWTGRNWVVLLSKSMGEQPLGQVRREREAKERALIEQHPAVRAVLEAFPEARISAIRRQSVTRDDETGTG